MARITRVSWCKRCHDAKRPQGDFSKKQKEDGKLDTIFAVWQGTARKWKWLKCNYHIHPSLYGFTPHIFDILFVEGKKIHLKKTCAVLNCGMTYKTVQMINQQGGKDTIYLPKYLRSETVTMKLSDWNALVKFTNTGYKL